MVRFSRLFSIVPLLTVFCFYACKEVENEDSAAEKTAETAQIAEDIPAFMMVDEAGSRLDLSTFKGKKLFLNLWATWCPPCRAEMPSIQQLYNTTDRQTSVFVMLSLDEDFQSAKFYRSQENFSFPIYAPAQNLPDLLNVRGIPATFIFDENGKLIHQKEGTANYDTDEYRELLR